MKYRAFGKTGLRVSQFALGTANFGTGWGYGADPDVAEAVFNAYAEAGGNFIDTADVYQFGQSEALLGTLLQGRREDFVLSTKFTNGAAPDANLLVSGNSLKTDPLQDVHEEMFCQPCAHMKPPHQPVTPSRWCF